MQPHDEDPNPENRKDNYFVPPHFYCVETICALYTVCPKVITHTELICQSKRLTTMEARIHPFTLNDHHISYRMLGPCCLCPMLDASTPDFVEAVIDIDSSGKHAGQYVAACTKNRCSYLGKLSQCAPCTLDRF